MVETFTKYNGSGMILNWFIIAWLYLFFCEKDKPKRIMLVYVPALILLVFFNPLFYNVLSGLTEEAIYFRILWLLPITIVLGYAVIKVIYSLQGARRVGFSILAVVMIMVSGKLVYTNPLFSKAENSYHVPQEVVEICDAIRIEGREVMAVFPEEFLLYVRQYSPYVCMPYGREMYMGEFCEFFYFMRREEMEVGELAAFAKAYGCHYVILSEEKQLIGDMAEYQYEVFGKVGNYIIYRDNTMDFSLAN